jgi:hypothetical protein
MKTNIQYWMDLSDYDLQTAQAMLISSRYLYDYFTEDQKGFIDQLEPLNIEARYPSYKERLLHSLTPEKCDELISGTKIIQEWIKTKLSEK